MRQEQGELVEDGGVGTKNMAGLPSYKPMETESRREKLTGLFQRLHLPMLWIVSPSCKSVEESCQVVKRYWKTIISFLIKFTKEV